MMKIEIKQVMNRFADIVVSQNYYGLTMTECLDQEEIRDTILTFLGAIDDLVTILKTEDRKDIYEKVEEIRECLKKERMCGYEKRIGAI